MPNRIAYGKAVGLSTLFFADGSSLIEYMIFTNVNNGNSIINIFMEDSTGQQVRLAPMNMVIEKGQGYTDRGIRLPDRAKLVVQIVSGSFDYYILTQEDAKNTSQ